MNPKLKERILDLPLSVFFCKDFIEGVFPIDTKWSLIGFKSKKLQNAIVKIMKSNDNVEITSSMTARELYAYIQEGRIDFTLALSKVPGFGKGSLDFYKDFMKYCGLCEAYQNPISEFRLTQEARKIIEELEESRKD